MGRNNSPLAKKELSELIRNYETAMAEGRQIYLDGCQLADIADWYATKRRFDKAQEAIDYGLQLHPDHTDLLLEQAYLYLDMQKLPLAKKVANAISEEYDIDVKLLKAEIMLNEGKLKEAEQLLDSAENDTNLDTITDIAYLFLDFGYPDSALKWLKIGKELYADNNDYQQLWADYLYIARQFDEAINVYNALIDKSPYNSDYWIGLAKCYLVIGNAEKTLEACDFALAANEKCGEAYACRGHSHFYLNNSDEAIENYEKALAYRAIPEEMAYMFIGLSYSNKEEWQKADEYYTKVIDCAGKTGSIDPVMLVDTYVHKAYAAMNLNKYEEAHRLCQKARQMTPGNSAIDLTEGKIYLAEEKEEEAHQAFEEAAALNPEIETYYIIANAYEEYDNTYEAQKYFEKVYQLDPTYEMVAEKLCVLSLMTNEIDKFFKYNSEAEHPISLKGIRKLLNADGLGEEQQILKKVLKRMEKEEEERKRKEENN